MPHAPWHLSLLALGAAAVSFCVTRLAISAAHRHQLLAQPVARSSHSIPTPQVGGLGLGAALLAGLALTPGIPFSLRSLLALVVLGGLALGFVDDLTAMDARPKFAALVLLAALPVLWNALRPLVPPLVPVLPLLGGGLCGLAAFGWLLYFTNAYNFMDGVNGQSAIFALNALLWFGLLIAWERPPSPAASLLPFLCIFAGAMAGFLPLNFPRAATFLGDSGSLPAGAVLALLALLLAAGDPLRLPAPLLILSPYLYDVTFTLLRRLRRGENLLQAHRSHLYQRLLVATGWSHARLLAFHLPFHLLAGAAGLAYALFKDAPSRCAILLAGACLFALYTGLVAGAEKWRSRPHA